MTLAPRFARFRGGDGDGESDEMRAAGLALRLLLLALAAGPGGSAEQGGLPAKKLRMAYATGPLLKFQIW